MTSNDTVEDIIATGARMILTAQRAKAGSGGVSDLSAIFGRLKALEYFAKRNSLVKGEDIELSYANTLLKESAKYGQTENHTTTEKETPKIAIKAA